MADCIAWLIRLRVDAEFTSNSGRPIQRSWSVGAKLRQSLAAGGVADVGGLRRDCGAWFRHEFVSPDIAFPDESVGAAGVGSDPAICFASVHLSKNALAVCHGIGFARNAATASASGNLGDGGDFFADAFAEPDVDVADIAWRFDVVVGVRTRAQPVRSWFISRGNQFDVDDFGSGVAAAEHERGIQTFSLPEVLRCIWLTTSSNDAKPIGNGWKS